MNLQQHLAEKLVAIETKYQEDKALLEADFAKLTPFLAHEVEEVKAWFESLRNHL